MVPGKVEERGVADGNDGLNDSCAYCHLNDDVPRLDSCKCEAKEEKVLQTVADDRAKIVPEP